MDIGTRPRGQGFWKGLVTGLVVATLLALLLAFFFPPVHYIAPEVPVDTVNPPGAPRAPEGVVEPNAPRTGGLLPDPAPAPLIGDRPGVETPPGLPGLSPPRAPDVFDGAASGSPSLVPQGTP